MTKNISANQTPDISLTPSKPRKGAVTSSDLRSLNIDSKFNEKMENISKVELRGDTRKSYIKVQQFPN